MKKIILILSILPSISLAIPGGNQAIVLGGACDADIGNDKNAMLEKTTQFITGLKNKGWKLDQKSVFFGDASAKCTIPKSQCKGSDPKCCPTDVVNAWNASGIAATLGIPLSDLEASSKDKFLASLEQNFAADCEARPEQLLLTFPAHGSQFNGSTPDHGICLGNGQRLYMSELKAKLKQFKDKNPNCSRPKLAVIDLSCKSGGSVDQLSDQACVISATQNDGKANSNGLWNTLSQFIDPEKGTKFQGQSDLNGDRKITMDEFYLFEIANDNSLGIKSKNGTATTVNTSQISGCTEVAKLNSKSPALVCMKNLSSYENASVNMILDFNNKLSAGHVKTYNKSYLAQLVGKESKQIPDFENLNSNLISSLNPLPEETKLAENEEKIMSGLHEIKLKKTAPAFSPNLQKLQIEFKNTFSFIGGTEVTASAQDVLKFTSMSEQQWSDFLDVSIDEIQQGYQSRIETAPDPTVFNEAVKTLTSKRTEVKAELKAYLNNFYSSFKQDSQWHNPVHKVNSESLALINNLIKDPAYIEQYRREFELSKFTNTNVGPYCTKVGPRNTVVPSFYEKWLVDNKVQLDQLHKKQNEKLKNNKTALSFGRTYEQLQCIYGDQSSDNKALSKCKEFSLID